MDTETTGLGDCDQVIEIAVIEVSGDVLLHSMIRPSVPVKSGAREVHGIGDDELAEAPTFSEIWFRLGALLRDRTVIAHNADINRRMITQSAAAAEIPAGGQLSVLPRHAPWNSTRTFSS